MNLSETTHPLLWQELPQLRQTLAAAQLEGNSILVGLSGGVDSSVTALCLKALGYEVAGLFMKNWDEDDGTEYCTARQDLADAQSVADQLEIKLHTANFSAEYWDQVFEHFLASYKAGFTPNPDVLCNREIKFQVFRDYAKALGFQNCATGHYAFMQRTPEKQPLLCMSHDTNKDQTYFLNAVAAGDFNQVVFPLAHMNKPLVRELATEASLTTQRKKDSTGICFIGERRFQSFLSQYLPAKPGKIVLENGEVVGEHQGLMYYTLGQRKGIGIGGTKQGEEKPWFVAKKDLEQNQLVIVQEQEHPLLMSQSALVTEMNWISLPRLEEKAGELYWHGFARCRHRQALVPVSIRFLEDISNKGQKSLPTKIEVFFETPQWAVTPGQYLVLYENQTCLGGGPVLKTSQVESKAE